jgi:membrane protease YdiL (CAAX protease family)
MLPANLPWDFILILLVLAVVVPWRGAARVRALMRRPALTSVDRIALYASTIAFQWLATAIILWRATAHGYKLSDLGLALPSPWLTVIVALALSALITFNQAASIRRLASLPNDKQGFMRALTLKLMPQTAPERLAFFALVSTVALCEEIIYRGFIQRLFLNVSNGSLAIAILGAAVFFALAHLYQGRRGLIVTFFAGAIFSAVRAWTGTLLPTMAAHFVADLSVGLLAPRLLTQRSLPAADAIPAGVDSNP